MYKEPRCIITDGKNYISMNDGCPYVGDNQRKAKRFKSETRARKFMESKTHYLDEEVRQLLSNAWIVRMEHTDSTRRKPFRPEERELVYEKSQGHCCLCGKSVTYEEFTIDHIHPLAKGGSSKLKNLQCTCRICNRIKQDILPQEFMDRISEIFLYQMECDFDMSAGKKIVKMAVKNGLSKLLG